MKKNLFLLSCLFSSLFFSCTHEEIIGDINESQKIEISESFKKESLNKFIEKYGHAIESITENVDYFEASMMRSSNIDDNNKSSIEIAFPSKKRDLVKFKTGETIEVCDSFYIYQADIILSEEQVGFLAGIENYENCYVDNQSVTTRGAVIRD